MDKNRDSSLWRNLAVAFGDGLAFGVGMKLTQNVPGKAGTPKESDVAERLAQIEHRVERIEQAPASSSANLDPGVLDALLTALEARLQESAAQLDRRLAELDVKLAVELKALRQQDQALASGAETHVEEIHQRFNQQVAILRQKVNEDRNALQSQVIALHREFAGAVADIVEEQVANQVELRVADAVNAQLASLEQRLREEIRETSAAKHRDIADLQQRITENDRNVLDMLLTVGELFRKAAGRLGAPNEAAVKASAEAPAPVPEVRSAPEERVETVRPIAVPEKIPLAAAQAAAGTSPYSDADLPGFAQPRKASAAWSIPLVSSFLVAAGCVVLLQYL